MRVYDPADVAGRLILKYEFVTPPVNVGLVLLDFPIQVVLRDWPDELAGLFARGVHISHIGLNANHPRERRHFTLWHEFYHFLAHKGVRYMDFAKSEITHVERDADLFAVNVLMPEEWVRSLWIKHQGHTAVMARECLVSRTAMLRRVRELGLRRH